MRFVGRTAAVSIAIGALAAAGVLVASAPRVLADVPPATSTIDVNVGTFRNTKGWFGCRLYGSPPGFPKEPTPTQQRLAITGSTVRCTFTNVTAGAYAVSVMHDENGNGKLDSNFLGIPTEGYGVSNNHTHALSAPTWDESKFEVTAGQDVRLGIALRY
jgi:uncharacterized protein (DUF2141 family)